MEIQDAAYLTALELLNRASTTSDLKEAGKQIQDLTAKMAPAYIDALRGFYHTRHQELEAREKVLEGQIKTADLNKKPVLINSVTEVQTRLGRSLLLKGTFTDSGQEFQCWCPGSYEGYIARFYRELAPTEFPVLVIHQLGPHPGDPNKTLWTMKRLPKATDSIRESVPF